MNFLAAEVARLFLVARSLLSLAALARLLVSCSHTLAQDYVR